MNTKEKQLLVGLKLRNCRKLKNYTQEKLCGAINTDISSLSKIENGKCFPSFETFCLIMEELKINPVEFFDFINFENTKNENSDSLIFEKIKMLKNKEKEKLSAFLDVLLK